MLFDAPPPPVSFTPGAPMRDDRGFPLQAHGAGIFKVGATYYLVGDTYYASRTDDRSAEANVRKFSH